MANSLNKLLKDADEKVRRAAADALNEAAEKLERQIKQNMADQGIQEDTGELRGSIKFNEATPKKLAIVIKSEVYAPMPKEPGKYNPAMKGRYQNGVPYGRIIEFGVRKDKDGKEIRKPFFYTAWYKQRDDIKEAVMEAIGEAWSKG